MRTSQFSLAVLSTAVIQLHATKLETPTPAPATTSNLPKKPPRPCFWTSEPPHGIAPFTINDNFSYYRLEQPTFKDPAVAVKLQYEHLTTVRPFDSDVEEKLKIVLNLTFFYGPPTPYQPEKGKKTTLYGIETCQAAEVNGDHGLKWSEHDCFEGLSEAWRFFKGEGPGVSWLYGTAVGPATVGPEKHEVFLDRFCPWHYQFPEVEDPSS